MSFVAGHAGVEHMGDHRAEKKPPEFDCAVKSAKFEWLDAKAAIA